MVVNGGGGATDIFRLTGLGSTALVRSAHRDEPRAYRNAAPGARGVLAGDLGKNDSQSGARQRPPRCHRSGTARR